MNQSDIDQDELRQVTAMLNVATADRLVVEVVWSFAHEMKKPGMTLTLAAVNALNAWEVTRPDDRDN